MKEDREGMERVGERERETGKLGGGKKGEGRGGERGKKLFLVLKSTNFAGNRLKDYHSVSPVNYMF